MPTHICLGKESCKNSNTWGHGLTSLFDLVHWPLSFTRGKALRQERYPNLGPHLAIAGGVGPHFDSALVLGKNNSPVS